MAGAVAPKRQDTRKFFENLSGAGKSIAVLTSGGDAQGKVAEYEFHHRTGPLPQLNHCNRQVFPKYIKKN